MSMSPTLEMVRAIHPGVTRLMELPPGTQYWQIAEFGPVPAAALDCDVDSYPIAPPVAIRTIALHNRYRTAGTLDVMGVVDGNVFYYAQP